jgi:hypothetical protein
LLLLACSSSRWTTVSWLPSRSSLLLGWCWWWLDLGGELLLGWWWVYVKVEEEEGEEDGGEGKRHLR